MKRALSLSLAALLFAGVTYAQDDLLNDLKTEDAAKVKQDITTATFKSTRIINMHSVEMTGKGNLQFMIIHHFGNLWENLCDCLDLVRGLEGIEEEDCVLALILRRVCLHQPL
jgi:hypothetical protein